MKSLTFALRPVPPFRLDLTAWALRRRARNIVDRWDGTTYRRVLVIDDAALQVEVTQTGACELPKLAVTVTGPIKPETRPAVTRLLVWMLGLRIDLQPFYVQVANDRRLGPLVEQFRGLKPPRFPSVFEALVNATACQLLSVTAGVEILNRLAMQRGSAIATDAATQHAFPTPKELLLASAETLNQVGFSYKKASSLLALSQEIVSGKFRPEQMQALESKSAVEQMTTLRGVGRWTAEYVLLRGLGRVDTFPGDDVGARNRLALWLGREGPMDYEGVNRAVRRWQPFAGMVYFHLLLSGLTEAGELSRQPVALLTA